MQTIFKIVTLICALSPIWAQSETGKAAVEGRILDSSGQSVNAADVSILETQTGFRRKTATAPDGKFRFSSLPVGVYDITATALGFGEARATKLEATVGETKSVTITLSVASITTQVNVEGGVEVVNLADTNNSTSVNERAIENLPIRGPQLHRIYSTYSERDARRQPLRHRGERPALH